MGKGKRNLLIILLLTTVEVFMFLTPALAFPEDVDTEDVPGRTG